MRVAVLGAGRMGRALVRAIEAAEDVVLAGVWSRGAALDPLLAASDVVIDFTLPAATPGVLDAVERSGRPLVSGVTGLDEGLLRRIGEIARSVPLLYDRNMSPGIAVLTDIAARAAASLGDGFAVAVHETHHVHKKDAPSGTALKLGEALAGARRLEPRSVCRYGPEPATGSAAEDGRREIVITSERRGEVTGEHTVRFTSDAETLTLAHAVTDRRVFAEGALRAARWLIGRGPGLYSMRDVVGGGESASVPVK